MYTNIIVEPFLNDEMNTIYVDSKNRYVKIKYQFSLGVKTTAIGQVKISHEKEIKENI